MPAAEVTLSVVPAQTYTVERRTIAICLVIVDELYHEDIWREWVKQGEREEEETNLRVKNLHNANVQKKSVTKPESSGLLSSSFSVSGHVQYECRARLFIHAKHPHKIISPWVRARTLGTIVKEHSVKCLVIIVITAIIIIINIHYCNVSAFPFALLITASIFFHST